MKYIFFILLSAAIFACNITDKKETPEEKTKREQRDAEAMSQPTTIEWIDSTTLVLGEVKAGQEVELTWKFKNVGQKPLVIQDVRPTCGCTIADKPKEPIAPGEQGVIKATYRSSGDAGQHINKHLTVLANITNHNSGNETNLGFVADVKE
jgi:hypothetical protein